jgi:1-acyl-sn-glycerol-3-phosphate acyltransferase
MIARTVGVSVRLRGAENLRAGESYVFLSTHQSYMDIPVMLGYLPAQLRIAAKREVFRIPFLGWHMRRGGHISINRGSTAEAVASLRRAAREIQPGVSFFLFPEGTRTRDGKLVEFKAGIGMLVAGTSVPVIPCRIEGAFEAMPARARIPRPRRITLRVGEALRFDDVADDRGGWAEVARALHACVAAAGDASIVPT